MNWIKKNWKEILINLFVMVVVFSIGFSGGYFWNKKIKEKEFLALKIEKEKKEERVRKEKEKKEKIRKEFKNLNLQANGVLIKEFDGQEIYSKNKNKIFPIASLTKIVNAIVFLEKYPGEKVYISPKALKVEGDYGLLSWEVFNQRDALKYMLIGSVNDIASAVSFGPSNYARNWSLFMDRMKEFTEKNNLNNTLFFSENGLNIAGHIMGAYSTPEDVAKFVKYFYQNHKELAGDTIKIVDKICSNKKCHFVKNTDILLEEYPEIIFSKTGFTKKAGGSLATIVKIKNKKYIVVVLSSTRQGRFDDMEKIINLLKKL